MYTTIYADFEARNSPKTGKVSNQTKTADMYKQVPTCNVFYVENKLKDLPINPGYYQSPSGEKKHYMVF